MNIFKKGDRVKIKKHKGPRDVEGYICQQISPGVKKCANCTMFLSKVYTVVRLNKYNDKIELEPHDWNCIDNTTWNISSFERAYKWIKIK